MTEQIEAEYAPPATVSPAPAPAPALESPVLESAALRAERERLRRARVAYEAKLSRLRLYSYCLTLTSCVLALMSFMTFWTALAGLGLVVLGGGSVVLPRRTTGAVR